MDDAAGMSVGQRLAHLGEDVEKSWIEIRGSRFVVRIIVCRVTSHDARATITQQGREGLALYQLHGEVGPLVAGLAEVVDGHDAGVLQLAADLRFLDKALQQFGAAGMSLQHDLDSDVTTQVGIAALEDSAHAAAGDLAGQLLLRPAESPDLDAAAPQPAPAGWVVLTASWSALSSSPAPLLLEVATRKEKASWF